MWIILGMLAIIYLILSQIYTLIEKGLMSHAYKKARSGKWDMDFNNAAGYEVNTMIDNWIFDNDKTLFEGVDKLLVKMLDYGLDKLLQDGKAILFNDIFYETTGTISDLNYNHTKTFPYTQKELTDQVILKAFICSIQHYFVNKLVDDYGYQWYQAMTVRTQHDQVIYDAKNLVVCTLNLVAMYADIPEYQSGLDLKVIYEYVNEVVFDNKLTDDENEKLWGILKFGCKYGYFIDEYANSLDSFNSLRKDSKTNVLDYTQWLKNETNKEKPKKKYTVKKQKGKSILQNKKVFTVAILYIIILSCSIFVIKNFKLPQEGGYQKTPEEFSNIDDYFKYRDISPAKEFKYQANGDGFVSISGQQEVYDDEVYEVAKKYFKVHLIDEDSWRIFKAKYTFDTHYASSCDSWNEYKESMEGNLEY